MQHWHSHAPGSLMLFGEHAVLQQRSAIAAAIDHWLHIEWKRRDDDRLIIRSVLADHETDWQQLADHPKLSFLMVCLQWFKNHASILPGLEITILSDINSTQGLGSSSAVVAAMLCGLMPLSSELNSVSERFVVGRDLIRLVQGAGSGTDLAAALTGGVMQLSPETDGIERLADQLPIVSVYVGYKTPTPVVIQRVQQQWSAENPLWHGWLDCVDDITQQAKQALQGNDLVQLGRCMNMAQGLMQGLGVSNADLDSLVHQLRATDGLLGAKISGSGLGDCVIALGTPAHPIPGALPVAITPQAAYWHSEEEANK